MHAPIDNVDITAALASGPPHSVSAHGNGNGNAIGNDGNHKGATSLRRALTGPISATQGGPVLSPRSRGLLQPTLAAPHVTTTNTNVASPSQGNRTIVSSYGTYGTMSRSMSAATAADHDLTALSPRSAMAASRYTNIHHTAQYSNNNKDNTNSNINNNNNNNIIISTTGGGGTTSGSNGGHRVLRASQSQRAVAYQVPPLSSLPLAISSMPPPSPPTSTGVTVATTTIPFTGIPLSSSLSSTSLIAYAPSHGHGPGHVGSSGHNSSGTGGNHSHSGGIAMTVANGSGITRTATHSLPLTSSSLTFTSSNGPL
jgi:hypothetical protein